tara:strand:- start:2369 stop:2557 length:189 start_codon:yes stop_codon:yes gene_type:complete
MAKQTKEKCPYCGTKRSRKRKPYGLKGKHSWSYCCDMTLLSDVNKKNERQKAKKEIKKELDE